VNKNETMFVRVTKEMKARIASEARLRSESESVIVREALREYFDSKPSFGKMHDLPPKNSK
jgi:predicted transcriptional regulator